MVLGHSGPHLAGWLIVLGVTALVAVIVASRWRVQRRERRLSLGARKKGV
jgi:FtsZ-interacting cell division protein ZipA